MEEEMRKKMLMEELESEKKRLFSARTIKEVKRIEKRIRFLERLLLT